MKLSDETKADIKRLYEAGCSYSAGAKILGIPLGTFAGTIYKARQRGEVVQRHFEVDERHSLVPAPVSLPKLKFLEG